MKGKRSPGFLVPLFLICTIVFIWEVVVRWRAIPEWILPGPVQITKTLFMAMPLIISHSRITMLECGIGFVLAIILAFMISFVMEEIPFVKQALYPLIIASQTIPIVSVAPLFIIWFGYGILPKILVVILICFFPVALSLLSGLAAVDNDYVKLFRSMGANRWITFRLVKLPLALPSFFSGLKIAASYSVMGAVIGEWLGAKQGLGTFMTLSQRSFQVDRVFAAILVITILSLALFAAISLIERLVIPWSKGDNFV